jgi:hypothetical protein
MGVVSVPPVAPRMPGKAIWGGAARNFQFSHGLDPFRSSSVYGCKLRMYCLRYTDAGTRSERKDPFREYDLSCYRFLFKRLHLKGFCKIIKNNVGIIYKK